MNPVFVPFVLETARYLSGLDRRLQQVNIDSILELGGRLGAGVQVFNPSGERALTLAGSVAGEDLRRAGVSELAAVNPDPRESNLRPMEADLVSTWEKTGRNQEAAPMEGNESLIVPPPLKLWKILLVLLVLIALVESIFGNYHLKVQRET